MSSIRKNFAYNILLAISQILFPLVTFPYVTRVLGPESLGTVNFVDSYAGYFILIASLGIPVYGVREIAKAKTKEQHSQIFSEIFSIHFILTIFSVLIYFISIIFYPKLGSTINLLIWGGIMIFSCIFIGEWYFQGLGKFKFIAIRTMLIRLLSVIFLYYFVKNKEDTLNYFLIIVFSVLVNAAVNFFHIKKEINIKLIFDLKKIKHHFKPLFYIFFSRAAVTLFLFLDIIILGFLSSDDRVGIFSTALKVTKIPILVVSSLGVVLIPKLTETYHNNEMVVFEELITKSVNFVISLSIPILFFFFSSSSEIILAFAGKQYFDASLVIKILSPIILIIGLSNIFSMQILTPMGRDKEVMFSVLLAIVVCLTLDFLLIPILKQNGAAITNFFVELTVALCTFYFASKQLKNIVNWHFFFKSIIYALPSLVFIYFIKLFASNTFLILILSGVAFIIYFSVLNIFILKNELYIEIYSRIKYFIKK